MFQVSNEAGLFVEEKYGFLLSARTSKELNQWCIWQKILFSYFITQNQLTFS